MARVGGLCWVRKGFWIPTTQKSRAWGIAQHETPMHGGFALQSNIGLRIDYCDQWLFKILKFYVWEINIEGDILVQKIKVKNIFFNS